MNAITKVHTRVIAWIVLALAAYLLASWITDSLFGIQLSTQFILLAVAGPMATDVYSRIQYLHNHTKDENTAVQRRTVLMAIPLEVLFVLLCAFSLLTTDCNTKDNMAYYELDDFEGIIVGQSTAQDVLELAPCDTAAVSAEGIVLSYPMEDGRWIVIKFYENQNSVGAIAIVDNP